MSSELKAYVMFASFHLSSVFKIELWLRRKAGASTCSFCMLKLLQREAEPRASLPDQVLPESCLDGSVNEALSGLSRKSCIRASPFQQDIIRSHPRSELRSNLTTVFLTGCSSVSFKLPSKHNEVCMKSATCRLTHQHFLPDGFSGAGAPSRSVLGGVHEH